MTDAEIDKLEAGPELDRLVAEAIYEDCTVGMCAKSGCGLPYDHDDPSSDTDVLAIWKGRLGRTWEPLPKYSTDWNAAMEAFERVDDDLSGQVAWQFGRDNLNWYCNIGGEMAWASSGPLAICRAILKVTRWPGEESHPVMPPIKRGPDINGWNPE